MRKAAAAIFLLAAIRQNGFAQKQVAAFEQIWMGYIQQTRLTDKWGIWLDGNLRTKDDFVRGFSVSILRAGVSYFISDNAFFTAGYAYGHYFPGNDGRTIVQPEHRPWQQFQWTTQHSKLRLQQRLRLEQRFRRKMEGNDKWGEGYHFNYRVRYNFSLSVPLHKNTFAPGTTAFVFNDEVMLNFGREIVAHTFDQNRLFAGFNYQLSKTSAVQLGYMNTFQQQAADRYRNLHTLRLNFIQNLDLRSKTNLATSDRKS